MKNKKRRPRRPRRRFIKLSTKELDKFYDSGKKIGCFDEKKKLIVYFFQVFMHL